jgi:hypothetical protein
MLVPFKILHFSKSRTFEGAVHFEVWQSDPERQYIDTALIF